jgi:predicted nucleotidyltransferase
MERKRARENIQEVMKKLEGAFLGDPRVLGAFYCGTSATGKFDHYSDIDLVLIVDEAEQVRFFLEAPKILKEALGLKSAVNESGSDKEWCCLVTDDYIGLDLPILTRADLQPSAKFAQIKILKDRDNFLADFKRKSATPEEPISAKKFINIIEDIKNAQLYFARHAKRGWRAKVSSDCIRLGEELYRWLVRLKKAEPGLWDLRDAEKVLDERELNLLYRTRPASAGIDDIRTAMQALWELTMHVIRKYEEYTGVIFPRSYDEREFLSLVEDVYDEKRF